MTNGHEGFEHSSVGELLDPFSHREKVASAARRMRVVEAASNPHPAFGHLLPAGEGF